jgi:AraC-like DNA-binding protein
VTLTSPTPHYFYRSKGESWFEFVRPILGSFNEVVAKEEQTYPKHRHDNYQLICAQRGRYRCLLNGVNLELQPRDLLLVKRGDWHEDIFNSRLHYLAVNFDLSGAGEGAEGDILFAPGVEPDEQIVRGPNEDIWRILESMQLEAGRSDHAVTHIENALMLWLFWSILRAVPRERLSPIFLHQSAVRAFGVRLRWLFEQHLSENLSTTQIAAKLGVSIRTLTKRCRQILGRPPAHAFMHYKMEHAAYALRQSNASIKEVSHRLGFQNQYHFSRVFRRYVGTPPSRYREVPK